MDFEEGLPELRVSRIVDGVFLSIYGLLGLRLLFALTATAESGLVRVITGLTDPLYAVFGGVLPSLTGGGPYTLTLPLLLAILLYAMLHAVARSLLRKVARRRAYP
jgi:hypothetical protein